MTKLLIDCKLLTLSDFSHLRDLSRRPIAQFQQNLRVRSWWFNRMKFSLIVLAPLFRSHCLTVGAKFLSDNEKSPTIIRPSLTTADHLQSFFSLATSSPTGPYFPPYPPICLAMSDREPTRWQHNRIYPYPINPCVYTYDSLLYRSETVDAHCSNVIKS